MPPKVHFDEPLRKIESLALIVSDQDYDIDLNELQVNELYGSEEEPGKVYSNY